jgi:hypothetical protein
MRPRSQSIHVITEKLSALVEANDPDSKPFRDQRIRFTRH